MRVALPRRDVLRLTAASAASLALGLPAAAQDRRSYDVTPWPRARPAPPLEALDLQGKTWRLADLRGRAVLVNFWATWCPPCRAEMPSLQQMAEFYGPEQLQVLAVNVKEGPRRITQFMQASRLDLTVLLDRDGEITRQWGASALPTTVLIDAAGQPRLLLRGEVDWTSREAGAMIEPLLRTPSRSGSKA